MSFQGQKVTIENTGMLIGDPDIFMLHNFGYEGLSEIPNGVQTGCNGGYQVVNIATLAGAAKVLLLGYDMRFPGGKSHWHKGHPVKIPEDRYLQYASSFKTMLPQLKKMGVSVINCTPGSALKAFPFSTIEEQF